ncbi:MAG: aconitate hydratase [Thermoanaerobacterales bacterium]|nr:aconitate hydratase [Bacillota bacterium]MDI6907611.1 aconitate hydratase [Thermoanaerobacterales bacterium]
MAQNVTQKILSSHIVSGELAPGQEIGIRCDQTLTQDATGTMVYLQFEAIGVPRVKTGLSVSYIDHNTLQAGFENADDHRFLASVAAKYGIRLSRPGNGICHQVHLERFAVPGQVVLGSDSHTPTAGGLGMLGIGAGGLDVAVALAGAPYYLKAPKVVGVRLVGRLRPWVAAKDVILEVLRRLRVKGGVGKVFEYFGDGVATLSVPERATITNMGAELGATSSVFPSDEQTRAFLAAQGREADWIPLAADPGAVYDETVVVNLDELVPLVAKPHSPDNVVPVAEAAGTPVQQVVIGSCTNSSYKDMATVAAILKGRRIAPTVSLVVAPGSRQVLKQMIAAGVLETLVDAGARILEVACGPCNGIGQAPASGAVSVRTVNRNYRGRSGTLDAQVYLASPEVAAAAALTGVLTDPRDLGPYPAVDLPAAVLVDDSMILLPPADGSAVEIVRGPNIKPFPATAPLPEDLSGRVMIKLGDNISTDDIMPAGAHLLSLRSNIPAMARYIFSRVDPEFDRRLEQQPGPWFVLAGENYGQGSSREHAVMAPLSRGLKGVIAKSFARIHRNNLINFGILPLALADPEDYTRISEGDELELKGSRSALSSDGPVVLVNRTKGLEIEARCELSPRERAILLAGGLLNYVREQDN